LTPAYGIRGTAHSFNTFTIVVTGGAEPWKRSVTGNVGSDPEGCWLWKSPAPANSQTAAACPGGTLIALADESRRSEGVRLFAAGIENGIPDLLPRVKRKRPRGKLEVEKKWPAPSKPWGEPAGIPGVATPMRFNCGPRLAW
jgi:hypothetical protein